jgi:16S rRNA (uracil1498-N3)-methyltransferase
LDIPYFFIQQPAAKGDLLVLDEANSRHAVSVLRMQPGEKLNLTDGKGNIYGCELVEDHKKRCSVRILEGSRVPPPARRVTIAISLLKNASRFEWFLEKSTEIGVSRVIPLVCARTEKSQVRMDRLEAVLVSALLQSRQGWLPQLEPPMDFMSFLAVQNGEAGQQRFIAHCEKESRKPLSKAIDPLAPASLILIGPEGDFKREEIQAALDKGFEAVSLGDTRLRTETAGIAASVIMSLLH